MSVETQINKEQKVFQLVWKNFEELTLVTEQRANNPDIDLTKEFNQIEILNEILKEVE